MEINEKELAIATISLGAAAAAAAAHTHTNPYVHASILCVEKKRRQHMYISGSLIIRWRQK